MVISDNERVACAGKDRARSTPDDPMCDVRRRDLSRRMLMCNVDELDLVDALLARIEKGRDAYGYWSADDRRNLDEEEFEELLDAQVYRAMKRVRAKRQRIDAIDAGLSELRDADAIETTPRPRISLKELPAPTSSFDIDGEGVVTETTGRGT